MTLARHRFKSLATAAGAAIGVFSVTALPSAADATVFEALDKNKDGVLTEGEIAPGYDADIIKKLDTDGSGGVSQAELDAAGEHFVVYDNETESEEDGQTVTRKSMKILKFSDSEGGDIHGELTTEVDKRVTIKRMGSGPELSEAELEALIEEALEKADVDFDTDLEFDTETIFEEAGEDGERRIIVQKIKTSKVTTSDGSEAETEASADE